MLAIQNRSMLLNITIKKLNIRAKKGEKYIKKKLKKYIAPRIIS